MKLHITAVTHTIVFVALMILLVFSFAISFVDLGAWNTFVAIAVAFVKSSLVVLFFMHVLEARASTVFAVLLGFLLAGTLVGFSVADVETRGEVYEIYVPEQGAAIPGR